MGFQIPALQLPKLPSLDFNSELGKLSETFNPSDMVGQVSGNVLSQQGSIEGMRSQLEGMRSQMQQASSAADFQAMSNYTAGLQQMTDVSCIMSSTKPAFVPMTPESLTTPLSNDGYAIRSTGGVGGGLMSEAVGAYLGVDPSIVDAVVSGDVNTLTSPDTLTDLTIAGAGAYASGMTGGVIPPKMASSIIGPVAGETIHGAVNSSLSADFTSMPSQLGNSPDVFRGLTSAIAVDQSGGLMEASMGQVIPGAMNYVDAGNLSSMSRTDINGIATNVLSTYNPDGYTGMLGGINMNDPSALSTGLTYAGLNRAVELGNVGAATNFTNQLMECGQPPTLMYNQIDNLSQTMPQTPGNVENYMSVRSMLENEIQKTKEASGIPLDQSIVDQDIAKEHSALLRSYGVTQNEVMETPSTDFYNNLSESIPMSQRHSNRYSIYPNYTNGEPSSYVIQEKMNYPGVPIEQVSEPQNCNWFNIACGTINAMATNAIINAPIIERSIISIVESNKRSRMYSRAMDLRSNVLTSDDRMAERILGKDTARKGRALRKIVNAFRR